MAKQFDLKTHVRNSKGAIIRKNPYRRHCQDGVVVYEREGKFYTPDDAPVAQEVIDRMGLVATTGIKVAPKPAPPAPKVEEVKVEAPKVEEKKDGDSKDFASNSRGKRGNAGSGK